MVDFAPKRDDSVRDNCPRQIPTLVHNPDGQLVAAVTDLPDHGPLIQAYFDGSPAASVVIDNGVPTITLHSPDGRDRLFVRLDPAGVPEFVSFDADGKPVSQFTLEELR